MRDYVMLWNAVALEMNRRDHTGRMNAKNNRGPTASSRALAIIHLAMHDAFFGLTGRPPISSALAGLSGPINPYSNVAPHAPQPWSADNEGAAVSGAAAATMTALYPDFRTLVDDMLRGFQFGAGNPAFDFGFKVGAAIVDSRKSDGSSDSGGVDPIDAYWRHREDPTDFTQGLLGPRWGAVKLFSAAAIPPQNAHPAPRSAAYNNAHDEVRVKGSKNPTSGTPGVTFSQRSPFETIVGFYWAYDGASQIGTPPRLYNQIVRDIIARNVTGSDRAAASARLLALINVAMGDAGIAAWYWKYRYQLWRPILGIREYDNSFWHNRDIVSYHLHRRCDPWWIPLGAPRTNEPGKRSFTPPFPAYPSGHATFGAACFEMTRRFFGVAPNAADNLAFNFVSDELDGRAIHEDGAYRALHRRHYDSLLQAMFDNSVSRVFLGVHWRFDGIDESVANPGDILTDSSDVGGVPIGRAIAKNIFENRLTKSAAAPGVVTPINLPPVP